MPFIIIPKWIMNVEWKREREREYCMCTLFVLWYVLSKKKIILWRKRNTHQIITIIIKKNKDIIIFICKFQEQ